jgi:hypothetical protein
LEPDGRALAGPVDAVLSLPPAEQAVAVVSSRKAAVTSVRRRGRESASAFHCSARVVGAVSRLVVEEIVWG